MRNSRSMFDHKNCLYLRVFLFSFEQFFCFWFYFDIKGLCFVCFKTNNFHSYRHNFSAAQFLLLVFMPYFCIILLNYLSHSFSFFPFFFFFLLLLARAPVLLCARSTKRKIACSAFNSFSFVHSFRSFSCFRTGVR